MKEKNGSILFLEPVFTHNVWGGSKLREVFHYPVEGDDIGECWGVAAHGNGNCKIKSGPFAGKTLMELWESHRELFGNVPGDKFPLLVKIIDAKADLSIQVHPDDTYAAEHENGSLGKMECWYILDCPKDASLVIGHNAGTRAELADMVEKGRWSALIREVPVKKGDFIQIDPGTVHAIKGGITILETQQNSDITYRVYDYGRLSGGRPRELHIAQSLDVITVPAKPLSDSLIAVDTHRENEPVRLIACRYYQVFSLRVEGKAEIAQSWPFLIMSVTEGKGAIDGASIEKGDHFIVPAGYGDMELTGDMQIIASTVAGRES
ncbi:MAG: class I mannose-6-phosphate isomerase [Muribaculaceae bacterium]|nr:class I mannose-6-phosphate isomerase [Roseburia sp.]MCM1430161.1 class I mannose-6-phosphate isomerase [Muribaculaceae bacterium]MCM1493092.1 class I mannose-6-phosphate isomerase [Muribaculaceae bacterium]